MGSVRAGRRAVASLKRRCENPHLQLAGVVLLRAAETGSAWSGASEENKGDEGVGKAAGAALFSLEKRRLRGNPIPVCRCLQGASARSGSQHKRQRAHTDAQELPPGHEERLLVHRSDTEALQASFYQPERRFDSWTVNTTLP